MNSLFRVMKCYHSSASKTCRTNEVKKVAMIFRDDVAIAIPHIVSVGIRSTIFGYAVVIDTTSTSHVGTKLVPWNPNSYGFDTYEDAAKFSSEVITAIQNFYN